MQGNRAISPKSSFVRKADHARRRYHRGTFVRLAAAACGAVMALPNGEATRQILARRTTGVTGPVLDLVCSPELLASILVRNLVCRLLAQAIPIETSLRYTVRSCMVPVLLLFAWNGRFN